MSLGKIIRMQAHHAKANWLRCSGSKNLQADDLMKEKVKTMLKVNNAYPHKKGGVH